MSDIQCNPPDVGGTLFQFNNGRYLLSEKQSEKMYYIKAARPERSLKDDGFEYPRDESGMADLFAECYKSETRYCSEKKSWFTYSEGAWRKDIEAHIVSRKVKEFCRLMVLYSTIHFAVDGLKRTRL